MNDPTRRRQVETLDGTPDKRMFWSIISDYNLKLALCELIDNGIDMWQSSGQKHQLRVAVGLESDRQLITVHDDAGGVKKDELRYLVAPGGSRNDPSARLIGIFGVGSKRAGVALGERVVITTRYRKETTHQVEISKEWIESSSWAVEAYAVPDIEPGTTTVDISHLRKPFTSHDVDELRAHLGEVYGWFIEKGCEVYVNAHKVLSRSFNAWAYPPDFLPKRATFQVHLGSAGSVDVEITGGLIRDRLAERDNYGVYFYCNHRLIAKELKTREVGYITGQAGIPHSDASLCRVIIDLTGPAQLMPWISSKSGINFSHQVFEQIRDPVVSLVTHFSSLSRRLRDDWDGAVLRHAVGNVEEVDQEGIARTGRIILPKLPRAKRGPTETLKRNNKATIENRPWTLGLVEAIAAVDIIQRQHLETKNRIALILLDSTFEIGLKEFIVHRVDLFPAGRYSQTVIANLFKNRSDVIDLLAQHIVIPPGDVDKARHYYNLRNKLIHERATVDILESDVAIYQRTVQRMLKLLFKLKF
jgi:hypothetical protein